MWEMLGVSSGVGYLILDTARLLYRRFGAAQLQSDEG
jgi:hypothetical protein